MESNPARAKKGNFQRCRRKAKGGHFKKPDLVEMREIWEHSLLNQVMGEAASVRMH